MDVIIIGNGGHSKVIQEMIACMKNYQIIAILDDKFKQVNKRQNIIYAPLSFLKKQLEQNVKVVIAIGNNKARELLFAKLNLKRSQYLTVIHPTAVVSETATIGFGTVVMPNALINAEAIIGDHCIINSGAIIEHENEVDHYSHISPNATLTGNVTVGKGVHVGASATIIPGIIVGSWSVIGAGSTVIRNIPANRTAVGIPTRLLDEKKGKSENKVVI